LLHISVMVLIFIFYTSEGHKPCAGNKWPEQGARFWCQILCWWYHLCAKESWNIIEELKVLSQLGTKDTFQRLEFFYLKLTVITWFVVVLFLFNYSLEYFLSANVTDNNNRNNVFFKVPHLTVPWSIKHASIPEVKNMLR